MSRDIFAETDDNPKLSSVPTVTTLNENAGSTVVTARSAYMSAVNDIDIDIDYKLDPTTAPEFWTDSMLDLVKIPRIEPDRELKLAVPAMKAMTSVMWTQQVPPCIESLLMYFLQHSRIPSDLKRGVRFGSILSKSQDHTYTLDLSQQELDELDTTSATDIPASVPSSMCAFGDKTPIQANLDNRKFIEWFTASSNLDAALGYFFMLSSILFRGCIKKPDTVWKHAVHQPIAKFLQFSNLKGPTYGPTINISFVQDLCRHLQSSHDFNRGVLRFLLFRYDMHFSQVSDHRLRALYEYTVEVPFRSHGFHALLVTKAAADYVRMQPSEFLYELRKINDPDLKDQADNVESGLKLGAFYTSNEKFVCDGVELTFKFWRYCRFFEGRCMLELSIRKNKALIWFLLGVLPEDRRGAQQMTALQGSERIFENYFKLGESMSRQHWRPALGTVSQRPQDVDQEDGLDDIFANYEIAR